MPAAVRDTKPLAGEVLHVAKATGIGGSERHLIDLLPGLQDAGVPVRLYLLEEPRKPVDELVDALESAAVPVTRGAIRGRCDPVAAARLSAAARTAAIVHTHLVHADLHGGAAVAARGSHGPSHVFSVHSERLEDNRPTQWAMKLVAKRATACIAISERTGEVACSMFGVSADQLSIVPYGVRVPGNIPTIPSDEFRLAVHSRLAPRKHIDTVVRAFSRAEMPNSRLTIIGDGAHRSAIEAAIHQCGVDSRVKLLGEVADVWPKLFAADAWISLSSTEGFGLALAEALGAGLACICADIPAHREVAQDSALFVPPMDIEAATQAIRRLHDEERLRGELAEKGRRRAAELSVEQMVTRTAAVYERANCDSSGRR
jgi:glycosyltransferase involved in cell wall biosynthesis